MGLSDRTYISQFDISPNGVIAVRKTTEIVRDGSVISEAYWRTTLKPADPSAADVLSDEPGYLAVAEAAWANLPPAE